MTTFTDLVRMLRPAGGGVHVVSTGVQELQALQKRIYSAADATEIDSKWRDAIQNLSDAKVCILGVPSDTGAGFTRGANRAPGAIREHLLQTPEHSIWHPSVVDLGDVYTVPHYLYDELLSDQQKNMTAQVFYGGDAHGRPVSPLDICEAALRYGYTENPDLVPIVIGGDHSVGWPAFKAAYDHWESHRGRRIGLLHFDAHTDLLKERLGVRYCFATWAYHANELLGRDGRLVQVGIRTSGRTRDHWESTLGVRQYWAEEANERGADSLVAEIADRFKRLNVDALYVSNDIDGTDPAFAAATGTPEPGGLTPGLVSALTRELGEHFPLIGGDLVEVAPPLAGDLEGEPTTTLNTAAAYVADLVELGLRHS
jgi:arginase family enzyme